MRKNVTVVLTQGTGTRPFSLTLQGYAAQNYRNFEVVVLANTDFSLLLGDWYFKISICTGPELINYLQHSHSDYVIFADAYAIPRFDFVEEHIKNREEGYYLTGSRFFIQSTIWDQLNLNDIESGACFNKRFLQQQGLYSRVFGFRPLQPGIWSGILDRILPCLEFNFSNASLWKADFLSLAALGQWDDQYSRDRFYRNLGTLKKKSVKNNTFLMAT
jgi:hypothetical protein